MLANGKFAITPFRGFGFNIGLKGTQEVDGERTKIAKFGGKLAVDASLGIKFSMGGFVLGWAYHFPVNKRQESYFGEDAYPEIFIGFGF